MTVRGREVEAESASVFMVGADVVEALRRK